MIEVLKGKLLFCTLLIGVHRSSASNWEKPNNQFRYKVVFSADILFQALENESYSGLHNVESSIWRCSSLWPSII